MAKKKQSNPAPPKRKRPKAPPGPPPKEQHLYVAMKMRTRMPCSMGSVDADIRFPKEWAGLLVVYKDLNSLKEENGEDCEFTTIAVKK